MNIKEALYQTNRALGNFLEAEILLASCLNLERLIFYLNPERTLTRQEWRLLEEAIEKRKNHLPLAYIMGKKEFYSLEFKVTSDTFIPRPETEFLVEAVLKRLPVTGHPSPEGSGQDLSRANARGRSSVTDYRSPVTIVDLGTGCGNIAITLAKYISNSRIYATDISKKALNVAQENAHRHRVEDRITFLEGDLFSPLKDYHLEGKIDFLISNPPYIIRKEISSLMPEVANYEPFSALDGGEDGFFFYRRIIEEAPRYLKPRGYLILELGIDQSSQVKEIIEGTLAFETIEIIKDYSEIERVIIAHKRR